MVVPKREKSAPTIPAHPVEKPWWKSTWLKVTAGTAAFSILLTNVISILSSSRALPAEFQKTSDQFFDWYGDYAAWKGNWTNSPEGFADMEEMNLSKEDFRLSIEEAKGGHISGTIETRGICNKAPYFDQFLVDGSISSWREAKIDIFEYVGGYRRNFARLRLERDDDIMAVTPLNDPGGIFVEKARIARAPLDLIGSGDHEALCKDKRSNFVRDALKNAQDRQSSGTIEK